MDEEYAAWSEIASESFDDLILESSDTLNALRITGPMGKIIIWLNQPLQSNNLQVVKVY